MREGAWDRECKGGGSQGGMGEVTEGENMSMSICIYTVYASMSYKMNHQTCNHGNILTSTSHIALELVASVFFERPDVRRKT